MRDKLSVKLSKDIVNIIRTTQRNNIELTHIADNKANVLMSISALMITFLLPLVLSNMSSIMSHFLYIPLAILTLTCFTTICIAAIVLKPSRLENFHDPHTGDHNASPFFFGNYYKMTPAQFYDYIEAQLSEKETIRLHLVQDMYFIGRRLAFKMTWIRRAFNIFILGIFLSLTATVVVLLVS
ncbi:MAG: hypothetical protein D6714_17780 [Bacteroidetes bacterium]|nr:MAG: hypothetical protein D6714_17780 [Bacteroidota bacterium]